MSKPPKIPKPPLPSGARTLALSQARAFAANAAMLCSQLTSPVDAGSVLAYLVNAGLAIELYFKTFMISGRGGHMEVGHDLVKLLDSFPPFLRDSFSSLYDAHPTAKSAPVRIVALKLSGSAPETPAHEHAGRYATFDQATASIARIFVDARYFFERLGAQDWAVIAYPTDAVSAILQALEASFQLYEAGHFKDQV